VDRDFLKNKAWILVLTSRHIESTRTEDTADT